MPGNLVLVILMFPYRIVVAGSLLPSRCLIEARDMPDCLVVLRIYKLSALAV